MPVLAADALSLAYGTKVIFNEASVSIEPGERMGIVGLNGTGKSTLLRILAGMAVPDSGRVTRAKGVRVGYLAQEHGDPGDGGLLDSVMSAAPRRDALEERLLEVERELGEAHEMEAQLALSEELAELHTELANLDQEFGAHRAEEILAGLGFTKADSQRPVAELSGGWRMRAALAALLFAKPDVMLLDEPTNHLDVPTVRWLSGFLQGVKQAVVLTCHDREFLNRHIRRVASFEPEGLRTFRGNYDDYLVQRELDLEHLENRMKRDEQRKKDLEGFVERFRAKASKARQAQSKAKMIERLEAQQVDLPQVRRPISIRFAPVARSGDDVLRVSDMRFGYGDRPLFEDTNILARRGDRIAITGVNGAGKTTLLRLVAGELKPKGGSISLGANVTPSYFAQHHTESLSAERTVLEEVWSAAPELSQSAVRGICGSFLFSGDDVEKVVGVLSGGEKARVALARLLARPGNFLLLDEPTNHLDTESADKLTQSLEGYDGTLVFVSHNLDFARRLSTVVWAVGEGGVQTYPGSFAEYLDHLAKEEARVAEEKAPRALPVDKSARKGAREAAKKEEAEKRRRSGALNREVQKVEARISALETELAELEASLADPTTHADAKRSAELGRRYEQVKASLEGEMSKWTKLEAQREAALAEE